MSFWVLAHIVHDKELMEDIRNETALCLKNEELDIKYMMERCPLQKSIWLECLRVRSGISSFRHVTGNTVLGRKLLRRGGKVMISSRQLHLDDAVFGKDAHFFDARRFLRDPELEQHPSFRPFGGDATLCLGRKLAKHTVFVFVALVLHHFDVELAMQQPFPKCEARDAGFGITMSREDLLLRTSVRRGHAHKF